MKRLLFVFAFLIVVESHGADGYLAVSNGVTVIGPGGSGGGAQTPWSSDIDGNSKNLTNAGSIQVSGSGSNYFGANVNVNGTVNAAGYTNSGLTASRIIMTDANKAQASAAASGSSVGVAGDGSAITFGSGLNLSGGTLTATGGGGSGVSGAVVFFGGSGGTPSQNVSSTAQYFSIPALARNTTETRSQSAVPFSGTLSNLVFVTRNVDTDGAWLSTTNVGIAIVTNGVTSSLWAVLQGNGTQTITNSGTRSVTVSQYDRISLLITNNQSTIGANYLNGSFAIFP